MPAQSKQYWNDAQGRLVPADLVKPIDKLRSELCEQVAAKADALQARLREFKTLVMGDVQTLLELAASEYEVKLGGDQGNVTLVSFDGLLKIHVQIQKSIEFGEQIHAAKQLIDECLAEWTKDSRPEIQVLIQDAFRPDSGGNLNTHRILALRKLAIEDERWKRAMTAINDAITTRSSKSYVRVYRRANAKAEWKAISLDLAAI